MPAKEITFEVQIDPCQVDQYELSVAPTQLSYFISDVTKTGALYNFAEVGSNCGYENELVITDLPAFVKHNSESKDFTITSFEDLTQAGTYAVEIQSSIEFATSATDLTLIKLTASTTFYIIIVDPCEQTDFLDWVIGPITTSVGAASFEVELTEAKDWSSLDFGNKSGFDLCGPRKYEVLSDTQVYESFMSFDGIKTVTIFLGKVADVGNHTIEFRASLENYPEIEPQ